MAPGSSPAVAYRPPPDCPGRAAEIVIRAAYCTLLADAGHGAGVRDLLEQRYDGDPATRVFLERAEATPATTSGTGWAEVLARSAVADFVGTLSESAAARLIAAGIRLDMTGVSEISVPGRSVPPPSTNLAFVGQGAPIPLRQGLLAPVTLGPPAKLAAIATLTSELARSSNGEAVMAQLLREDAAASLDAAMFSSTAADPTRPAGLLAGLAALPATAGGGDQALLADVDQLTAAVTGSGATEVVYVAATRQALAANLRLGRLGAAATVWPSAALAAGVVVAVAPGAFVSGFDSVARLEQSTEATLVMADPAAELVTAGHVVASPVRSLWQSDVLGIRLILRAAWALRSSSAAAWLTGATWG